MKTFILRRFEDESGVSGTGDVAEGVEFHDGQVVLSWFGKFHAINIYPSIETVTNIHGHQGKTQVIWVDFAPITSTPTTLFETAKNAAREYFGLTKK